MPRKSEPIARHSESELRAAGKTGSDWRAAAQKPVPAGDDPDDAMAPVDWATTELPMPRRKEAVSLRIDADVMDFFRAHGKGYQTRINAVLRSYIQQAGRGRAR